MLYAVGLLRCDELLEQLLSSHCSACLSHVVVGNPRREQACPAGSRHVVLRVCQFRAASCKIKFCADSFFYPADQSCFSDVCLYASSSFVEEEEDVTRDVKEKEGKQEKEVGMGEAEGGERAGECRIVFL